LLIACNGTARGLRGGRRIIVDGEVICGSDESDTDTDTDTDADADADADTDADTDTDPHENDADGDACRTGTRRTSTTPIGEPRLGWRRVRRRQRDRERNRPDESVQPHLLGRLQRRRMQELPRQREAHPTGSRKVVTGGGAASRSRSTWRATPSRTST
jgi:hypothetical protein